jgi:hypothetical protein
MNDTYHRVLGRLHMVGIDILDLDVFPRHGIPDGPPILAGLLGGHMVDRVAVLAVGGELGVDLGVSSLLVAVEPLDELLDVGDAVRSRVGLPSWVHFVVWAAHFCVSSLPRRGGLRTWIKPPQKEEGRDDRAPLCLNAVLESDRPRQPQTALKIKYEKASTHWE